ncbi:MAG: putative bifunctional diguanylate cyclase/phosphodiesterase [Acidimicrobiales bacterium]
MIGLLFTALAVVVRTEPALLVALGLAVAAAAAAIARAVLEHQRSTERRIHDAEAHSRATGERFEAIFDRAPIGMAELDQDGQVVQVNASLCQILEAERETIVGRDLALIVHERHRADHVARLESLRSGAVDSTQTEHRYRSRSGREIWVNERLCTIDVGEAGPPRLLLQVQDITAQRRSAWELMQKALHDDLTGLPNRALLLNRLKHSLQRSSRTAGSVAVLFIDIDRFKYVNDSLGHEMGDVFLAEIARRLEAAIRTGDTVARFGGDEFVVLCEGVDGASEALTVAQRVHTSLASPIHLDGVPTFASASIGISLDDEGDTSAEALLSDADAAMYRAKASGRNRSELFDASMRHAIVQQLEIGSQLRDALDNGQIVMHYQAIVDPITHLATGYEALVRWNHPDKGLLGPGAFLPAAEEAGLMDLIDAFALTTVCRRIADWSARFPVARNLYITTNWSARNMARFVQQVEQALEITGIDPRQLVIEVTEGFLLEDTESSLQSLQRLKSLGVQIAIDDFGTGYSSLSYLTRLAVDFLKIDKSFIDKIPGDAASVAVVGAIADIATRLGIGLVAEGVETDEQLDVLRALGSLRLQGYRFAKPRPAEDIERQLEMRSVVEVRGPLNEPVPVGVGQRSGELEA